MGKTLIPIFLVVLVDVFGLTLVIPLLAIYAERFHATPLQATLLVSVFALCQLAAALSATSFLFTLLLLPGGRPPAGDADRDAGPGGRRLPLMQAGTYAAYFRRPLLAALLLEFFLYVFSFSTFTSGFALFAERRF